MSLRLLWIFKIVVETGGISAASKTLYMSQPAVSHAIAQLEERVHLHLFERIGKRLYVSESGKQFYQKTCQVLAMVEELETAAKQLHHRPPLRIGSSITNAIVLLPHLLSELKSRYQGEIKVVVENARAIKEKLLVNEIDLAFLEGALTSDKFIAHPLFDYENLIFCAPDSPLQEKAGCSLKELIHEDWLLREKGSAIRDTFDSVMNLLDQEIQPAWESSNSQVLIEAVKANQGISILPTQLLQREIAEHTIALLPTKEKVLCKNHIVYHKEKYVQEGMKAVLDYCKEHLE